MKFNEYDIVGKRFGRLEVLRLAKRQNAQWIYECSCNCPLKTVFLVRRNNLISRNTISCGCYHSEVTSKAREKIPKTEHKKIKQLRESLRPEEIAEIYGVSKNLIQKIWAY